MSKELLAKAPDGSWIPISEFMKRHKNKGLKLEIRNHSAKANNGKTNTKNSSKR